MTSFEPLATWQPGDPLYSPVGGLYRQYLFNFRDEQDPRPEPGPDAASWPNPFPGADLGDSDELARFIAAERAHRLTQ